MTRGVFQTWKDYGSSKMQTFGWLEIPQFFEQNFYLYFHLKSHGVVF